jgi:APA family basic amino acid/polyamine antiporter
MEDTGTKNIGGKLKREVTLIALIAVMIGLNVGGGLFLLTAVAAGLTGPSIIIAQLIAAAPVLLAIIPYLVLSSAIPTTCANYQYAKLFSTPLASAAWMGLFIAIPLGAFPLFAIATAELLVQLRPGLPVIPIAIVVMTLFYLINVFGIKATAQVQLVTVAILLVAIFTFIVPGVAAIELSNLTPLFTGGAIGLIGASALMYTLLAGGLFGIEIGGEVKKARATVPKALIISVVIVMVMYLFIEVIAVGVMDTKQFAAGTLGTAAQAFLSNPWLGFFVIGGGILASVTTINLTLTVAGRYALAFARDGFFPGVFSHINKRFGTPHWGLTLPWAMTVITLLVILIFNPERAMLMKVLGSMLNFGLLFIVTLVLLASARLPKNHPDIYAKSNYKFSPRLLAITSISAAAINIVFMLLLAFELRWAFLLFVAAGIAGVVVYYTRTKQMGYIPSKVHIEQTE